MTTVNLYYCHSPICVHLALMQANEVGESERHVFISARNTHISRATFSIRNDVFQTRQEFFSYLYDMSGFINGICSEKDHLRVFVPHAASLPTRIILCHQRVDSVYFMEEGSAYYVSDPDHYSLCWPDYIDKFGITYHDVASILNALKRPAEDAALVIRSMSQNFYLFHDICKRVNGLLVTDEHALDNLSYRNTLNVIVRPLAPIFQIALERTVLYMLSPHHMALHRHGVNIDIVIETNRENIRSLLMMYEKVVIKLHPSDSHFCTDIIKNYLTSPSVTTYEQLHLIGPDGFPFDGEPSVLNFSGFYVGNSSARIYVSRIWGIGRIIDSNLSITSQQNIAPILERIENSSCMQHAFPSAFVLLPGADERKFSSLLIESGLKPTEHRGLYTDSWPVLPTGTFRITNGADCINLAVPQSSTILFIRPIRDCLCKILDTLLSHDYGQTVPPQIQMLMSFADDHDRMSFFLEEMGEKLLKQAIFGPIVKWLFMPGVLTLSDIEVDAVEYFSFRKSVITKITRHLNLPTINQYSGSLPDKNISYKELRDKYWGDTEENKFLMIGGEKIQEFYDFNKVEINEPINIFCGHWIMHDKIIINILPNGSVISRTGHMGRALANQRGQLLLIWDTLPNVYLLQFEGDNGSHMIGWTNYADDISATRW